MKEFEENDINIGNLGENEFSRWCAKAGLIVNRSLDEDSTGWDHIVQFPYEKTDLPKDLQPLPIECKIQVKTSFSEDKRGVNMKLSSLKFLVDYTSPAFILFLKYKNKREPELESAYLVHIGTNIIHKTLKKIRQDHISENPKKLNKIKIWISYTNTDKIENKSGSDLREAILKFVPNGIVRYQEEKRKEIESIGYDENGYSITFTAEQKELIEHFTDSAIGRVSSLKISNSIIKDNRFNLKDGSIVIKEFRDGEIKFSPTIIDDCQLRFKTEKYSTPTIFDGQILTVPNLIERNNTVFLKTTLFSIELGNPSNNKMDSKLHLNFDTICDLIEIIKLLKLFSTDNLNKKRTLEIRLKNNAETMKLEIENHNKIESSDLILSSLQNVVRHFNIDTNEKVNADEVFKNKSQLLNFSSLLDGQVEAMRVTVNDNGTGENPSADLIPKPILLEIGSYTMIIVILMELEEETENTFMVRNYEIIDSVLLYDQRITHELLAEITQRAVDNFLIKRSSDL